MIRTMFVGLGLLLAALIGLVVVSSRSVYDLSGYFQATADQTVDNLTGQLPTEVRDRKMEKELRGAKQELIDRQVALNLSRNQVEQLQKEIAALEISVAGREQLLADAYPVLRKAIERQDEHIRFASTEFTMGEFQQEIDDLLTEQDRQTRQLEIKRQGWSSIEASLGAGEQAVAEMRNAMENVEQEVATLKTRREQAEMEASTLDLISSVTASQNTAAATIGENVDRMKQQIEALEARNEARRAMTPTAETLEGRLPRAYGRLDTLKSYHDRAAATPSDDATPPAKDDGARKRTASKRAHASEK